MELTTLLAGHNDASSSQVIFDGSASFGANLLVVKKEWDATFANHMSKYNDLTVVDAFHKKYSSVADAVDQWEFGACSFISQDPTPEADAQAKRVQALASQFSVWRALTENCNKHVYWASDEDRGAMSSAIVAMGARETLLRDAARLLAMLMMSSVVLKGDQGLLQGTRLQTTVDATQTFIQHKLFLKVSDLPQRLQEKMQQVKEGGQQAKDASECGVHVAQGSGPGVPPAANKDKGKKKLKKVAK